MEKELEEYVNNLDLSESGLDPDLKILVEAVFKHAYLLGGKTALQHVPFYAECEDDNVWDEIYAKQLAEGKLTEIKQ